MRIVDSQPPNKQQVPMMSPAGRGYAIAEVIRAVPGVVWYFLIFHISLALLVCAIFNMEQLPAFINGALHWLLYALIFGIVLLVLFLLYKGYQTYHKIEMSVYERRAVRAQLEKQAISLERERVKLEREKSVNIAFANIHVYIQQAQAAGYSYDIDITRGMIKASSPTVRVEEIQQVGQAQALLPSPQQTAIRTNALGMPLIEDLAKCVERNSLTIPLGLVIETEGKQSTITKQAIIASIEASHIKIIGSSQRGKSCLAGGIIQLVTLTNDSSFLRIALLDLENKTSKLFADSEHLAYLDINGKPVSLHARNPQAVAHTLHHIRNLMDYRYSLPEKQQERQYHLLVYIEELLSLKRHRDLSDEMRARLLDDLNELAGRGLKAHIYLCCCAQVDYADDDLKAFANNFNINISLSVKTRAALSAGLTRTDLLKANYASKQQGQFVVECVEAQTLGIAPDFNVKARLQELVEEEEDGLFEDIEEESPDSEHHTDELPENVIIPMRKETNRATLQDAIEIWNESDVPIGRPQLRQRLQARGLECSDYLSEQLLSEIKRQIDTNDNTNIQEGA